MDVIQDKMKQCECYNRFYSFKICFKVKEKDIKKALYFVKAKALYENAVTTLTRRTVGKIEIMRPKIKKIDFFSFLLKLIPHYSKQFEDLSLRNVFVSCVNLRSYSLSKVRSF